MLVGGLALALLSGSAGAESSRDPSNERSAAAGSAAEQSVTCAGVALFPVEGELRCAPPPLLFDRSAGPWGADQVPQGQAAERDKSINYRALLEELVITKDVEIPGLAGMGVRMIPSRSAVAGSALPVVFIPRFVGTGWYGAEVIASF